MPSERELKVLQAIVEDYVSTREPVGSKSIVDKHAFGVSAATIRNDMAQLEEEDLITAPYTSAGRIPTDKGYRVFVDNIQRLSGLSDAQKRAIHMFLDTSTDLDDALDRSVRLLAQLTQQLAIVQYPSLGRSRMRHVELVAESENRVLLILILDSGRIYQRVIEAPVGNADAVQSVRNVVNTFLVGEPLTAVEAERPQIIAAVDGVDVRIRPLAAAVLDGLSSLVDDTHTEKLLIAGTANLIRRVGDFTGSVSPILEAIEEQVVLLRLMSEMEAPNQGVTVRIGHENDVSGFSETAVVAGGYEAGNTEVARLGVVGPIRMRYSRNMAAVRAVAIYLSRLFAD